MALIVDFLLLAASGAACFYCWVLSTRIKSVTNTKDGIHSGIVALTQSAEEIQKAIASTKDAATRDAAAMEQLLAEAEKKIPELRDLMTQLTDISQSAVQETETATKNLVETLSPHIKEAQEVSYQLLDALEASYATASPNRDDSVKFTENATHYGNAAAEEPDVLDEQIDVSIIVDESTTEGEAA